MRSDPFEVLGVSRSATTEEIRARFRSLAHLHTDRGGAPETWQRITDAYALLRDEERRAAYLLDQVAEAMLTVGTTKPAPPPAPPPAPRPTHLSLVPVPFLVALRGGIVDTRVGPLRIPRGAVSGATVAIQGREEGEVRHRLEVAPHPHLTRSGQDLVMRARVNALEAYRGGPIWLPSPWGPMYIRVPAAALETGGRFTVAGYGVRCRHQPGVGPPALACDCDQGDLKVDVTVDRLPPGHASLVQLLEQLLAHDNPRAALAASLT